VVQVRGGELDRAYITVHAAELGMGDLVERLFAEAAQIEG
jgi:hypothetical protein